MNEQLRNFSIQVCCLVSIEKVLCKNVKKMLHLRFDFFFKSIDLKVTVIIMVYRVITTIAIDDI